MSETKNAFSSNSVQLYACGGMAQNVISSLESARGEHTPGFAVIDPCYIDTSRSNLFGKNIPEESIYLLPDTDGSGKVRSTNSAEIQKNVKSILLKFKPRTFNIVVHSGGGGSGSVLAPTLVSELKQRGAQVVVIMVGSTDTRIEIENTIKTLKSYEAIAARVQAPVVTHYLENTRKQKRDVVDSQVRHAVSLLMSLFSGQNEELDTQDLKNWLNYTSLSGTDPCMASLNFALQPEDIDSVGTAISVATLYKSGMDTALDTIPAYQCVGRAPADLALKDNPIHYCISEDFIVPSITRLNKTLQEIDEVFTSRNARSSLISNKDNVTDTGLVL